MSTLKRFINYRFCGCLLCTVSGSEQCFDGLRRKLWTKQLISDFSLPRKAITTLSIVNISSFDCGIPRQSSTSVFSNPDRNWVCTSSCYARRRHICTFSHRCICTRIVSRRLPWKSRSRSMGLKYSKLKFEIVFTLRVFPLRRLNWISFLSTDQCNILVKHIFRFDHHRRRTFCIHIQRGTEGCILLVGCSCFCKLRDKPNRMLRIARYCHRVLIIGKVSWLKMPLLALVLCTWTVCNRHTLVCHIIPYEIVSAEASLNTHIDTDLRLLEILACLGASCATCRVLFVFTTNSFVSNSASIWLSSVTIVQLNTWAVRFRDALLRFFVSYESFPTEATLSTEGNASFRLFSDVLTRFRASWTAQRKFLVLPYTTFRI